MKRIYMISLIATLSAFGCKKKDELQINDTALTTDKSGESFDSTGATKAEPLRIKVVTSPEMAGAVNSTLLYGANELMIVDAQFTKSGANAVADAAEKTGKKVVLVFITHAHPDHYLGTAVLKERFPDAKFIATADVTAEMQKSAADTANSRKEMLGAEFPGQPVIPQSIDGESIELDGVAIKLLVGQKGDTHPITALYLESQGVLMASDIAFADVHTWTASTDNAGRVAWAKQTEELAKIPGLTRVIPGHQLADSKQTVDVLHYTKKYLEDFNAAVDASANADELMKTMKAKYSVKGEMFLEFGAQAAYAER